jgi:signal peptidase I
MSEMNETSSNDFAYWPPEKWNKAKIKKEILSYIFIFLGVFGFKSTFFEPNHIPSGSMLPTMSIGDFILVKKFAYGFKVPFSEWFGDPVYLTEFTPPKRGDIMVFEYPKDRSILFVKRLIGLPGDEIEVYDNRVYINGKELEQKAVSDSKELRELYDDNKMVRLDLDFFKVNLGDMTHYKAYNKSHPHHLDQGKLKIPAGHYFMMGDNRDFSSDSRVWGLVPENHIRGKALFVWFNMVYPWSNEKFHFRPWRIGNAFGSLK